MLIKRKPTILPQMFYSPVIFKRMSRADDLRTRWSYIKIVTMPTFNSCTKCAGSPGIIHDRTSYCHIVFWAWMTSQLNADLIR